MDDNINENIEKNIPEKGPLNFIVGSLTSFLLFNSAFFWLWAVPLWIGLWIAFGMLVSCGILCILVILRTISEFVSFQKTLDD